MKWIGLIAAVFAGTLITTACDNNGDTSSSPPSTTEAVPTSSMSPAEASSSAVAESSRATVQQQNLDAFVAGVQSEVEKLPPTDIDGRLAIIVTAYCTSQRPNTHASKLNHESVAHALSALYDEYWRAGGKWSNRLEDAAQQSGACPTLRHTANP